MALLKALVIGMGVLIVAGLAAIAFVIANRAGGPSAPAAAYDARVGLPPGARVVETHVDGGRLIVRVQLADGTTRIAVIDLASGRPIGALEFREGAAASPPRP